MARKTKEETEKTYHALLGAAQRIFVRQGIAKTTLNHIAIEAGMTRGAVYWHFENKDALILALWEEGAGHLNLQVTQSLENLSNETGDKHNAADEFRAIMQGAIKEILEDPGLSQSLRIMMNCVEITDEETPLREYLLGKHESYFRSTKIALEHLKSLNLLKSDLSPETLSSGMLSYVYGMIHIHLEPGDFINLERDGEVLIDLYLDGFLKS